MPGRYLLIAEDDASFASLASVKLAGSIFPNGTQRAHSSLRLWLDRHLSIHALSRPEPTAARLPINPRYRRSGA